MKDAHAEALHCVVETGGGKFVCFSRLVSKDAWVCKQDLRLFSADETHVDQNVDLRTEMHRVAPSPVWLAGPWRHRRLRRVAAGARRRRFGRSEKCGRRQLARCLSLQSQVRDNCIVQHMDTLWWHCQTRPLDFLFSLFVAQHEHSRNLVGQVIQATVQGRPQRCLFWAGGGASTKSRICAWYLAFLKPGMRRVKSSGNMIRVWPTRKFYAPFQKRVCAWRRTSDSDGQQKRDSQHRPGIEVHFHQAVRSKGAGQENGHAKSHHSTRRTIN